ncbi:MAG: type II toxin-antitoxin system RelE/ParE family toxin [Thermodesulfobacteriota bacterium]
MYQVHWSKRAWKRLKKVPQSDQAAIYQAVTELRHWPECKKVKALRGRSGYRLRVGRYRVIFEVKVSVKIISVQDVGKRDERTYK